MDCANSITKLTLLQIYKTILFLFQALLCGNYGFIRKNTKRKRYQKNNSNNKALLI